MSFGQVRKEDERFGFRIGLASQDRVMSGRVMTED